jgi:Protein of unknown function (DUF1625).
MAVTRVVRRNYGQRLANSFVGVLIGILLIIGSVVLIFWNEGRIDLSKPAKKAVEYSAGVQDGTLIYTVGTLTSSEQLSSALIKPAERLALISSVEMFANVEHEKSSSTTSVGGTEETTYTYTYTTEWTASPQNSSSFQEAGHVNPDKTAEMASYKIERYASSASINGLSVNVAELGIPLEELPLSPSVVESGVNFNGNYAYVGSANPTVPAVGDIRVTYTCVPATISGTVIGKLSGSKILSYAVSQKTVFYTRSDAIFRYFATDGLDGAVSAFKTEYKSSLWVFRIVGVLMIYFGLVLMAGPISALFNFIPFLAKAGGFVLNIVMIVPAIILGAITILVSYALNNWIAFIIFLALAVLFGVLLARKAKQRRLQGAGNRAPARGRR